MTEKNPSTRHVTTGRGTLPLATLRNIVRHVGPFTAKGPRTDPYSGPFRRVVFIGRTDGAVEATATDRYAAIWWRVPGDAPDVTWTPGMVLAVDVADLRASLPLLAPADAIMRGKAVVEFRLSGGTVTLTVGDTAVTVPASTLRGDEPATQAKPTTWDYLRAFVPTVPSTLAIGTDFVRRLPSGDAIMGSVDPAKEKPILAFADREGTWLAVVMPQRGGHLPDFPWPDGSRR